MDRFLLGNFGTSLSGISYHKQAIRHVGGDLIFAFLEFETKKVNNK
jgi:hypothetical protein